MKQLGSTDLKRLHRSWRRGTNARVSVILAGLSQPFNVGAIFRTAAAYRIEDVWLTAGTPGPEHTKVARTALGSDRYLRLHHVDDPLRAITDARGTGYVIVGLELADDATPLHRLDTGQDVALVIGHEDRGINQSVLDACDRVTFLPQLGRIGSLNVATATSIALYELRRGGWVDVPDA